ncbi:unnamed protein product [Clonostachys solani]|uniref:Uncharacterized protein n=1 Tax=Clonostachys solani TaxID=160281 RepID=A0A9N9Z827_9HYPO|nr:unnamed protein product [Clonostachys solani]
MARKVSNSICAIGSMQKMRFMRMFASVSTPKRGLDFDWDEIGHSRTAEFGDQTYFTCRWHKEGTWETSGVGSNLATAQREAKRGGGD